MDINNWLNLLVELDRARQNWHREVVTGMTPNQVSAILENESIGLYVWDNSEIHLSQVDRPIRDYHKCYEIYFKREQDITLFRLLK